MRRARSTDTIPMVAAGPSVASTVISREEVVGLLHAASARMRLVCSEPPGVRRAAGGATERRARAWKACSTAPGQYLHTDAGRAATRTHGCFVTDLQEHAGPIGDAEPLQPIGSLGGLRVTDPKAIGRLLRPRVLLPAQCRAIQQAKQPLANAEGHQRCREGQLGEVRRRPAGAQQQPACLARGRQPSCCAPASCRLSAERSAHWLGLSTNGWPGRRAGRPRRPRAGRAQRAPSSAWNPARRRPATSSAVAARADRHRHQHHVASAPRARSARP